MSLDIILHWLTAVLVTQRKAKLQTISTWLSPLNFIEKQTDLIEKRQEGTGQ